MSDKISNFWTDNGSPTRNLFIVIFITYVLTTIFSVLSPEKTLITTSTSVLMYVGQYNKSVLEGHAYLLITAIFVHANILHFLSNALFLLIYGLRLEERVYQTEYYIIFFSSALLGNLLTLLVFPVNTLSCGASGGIFGLLGADLILGYEEKRETRSFWTYLATGIIFLLLSVGINVNFAAHAAGLITGLLLPLILRRRKKKPLELPIEDIKEEVAINDKKVF